MSNYRRRKQRKCWKAFAEMLRDDSLIEKRNHRMQVESLRRELGDMRFRQQAVRWNGIYGRRVFLRKHDQIPPNLTTIDVPAIDLQLFAYRHVVDARIAADHPAVMDLVRDDFLKRLCQAVVANDMIAIKPVAHRLEVDVAVYFGKPVEVIES